MEVATDDDIGAGSRGECDSLAIQPPSSPAEDGVVRRLRIPPVAVDDRALRRTQSRPVALDLRVLDVPVAIPVIERVRVGEVDGEVSYSFLSCLIQS